MRGRGGQAGGQRQRNQDQGLDTRHQRSRSGCLQDQLSNKTPISCRRGTRGWCWPVHQPRTWSGVCRDPRHKYHFWGFEDLVRMISIKQVRSYALANISCNIVIWGTQVDLNCVLKSCLKLQRKRICTCYIFFYGFYSLDVVVVLSLFFELQTTILFSLSSTTQSWILIVWVLH